VQQPWRREMGEVGRVGHGAAGDGAGRRGSHGASGEGELERGVASVWISASVFFPRWRSQLTARAS
jgi:hypothetical protein